MGSHDREILAVLDMERSCNTRACDVTLKHRLTIRIFMYPQILLLLPLQRLNSLEEWWLTNRCSAVFNVQTVQKRTYHSECIFVGIRKPPTFEVFLWSIFAMCATSFEWKLKQIFVRKSVYILCVLCLFWLVYGFGYFYLWNISTTVPKYRVLWWQDNPLQWVSFWTYANATT